MRIRNTIKNSLYAMVSFLIVGILSILVRRIFLKTFSAVLLGYEGLFGNIFALLALVDLGLDSVILYKMFPAVSHNDYDNFNRLLAVYKYLFRIAGVVVLLLGLGLSPFLKFIIKDNSYDWTYVFVIFYIQLIVTLCTYFMAYKRIVFAVNQQDYVCIRVDTMVGILFQATRIIVILVLHNYIIYLACGVLNTVLGNFIISRRVKDTFPYINSKTKASLADIKQLGLGKDLRNNFVQKVCGTIYGATDNLLISVMLGIEQVGLMSNYLLISGYITSLLTKILQPFQMSIGNYIYSTDKEKGNNLFKMFDFLSFVLASIVVTCYFNLFNPTITFLFGEEYLLGGGFVASFCLNQYVLWNHRFLLFFRNVFGKFELDRNPAIIAAVLNLVFSIVLCKSYGITGIMLGTVIGHLGFWLGRVRVFYSEYALEPVWKYWMRQIIRLVICFVIVLFSSWLCSSLEYSVWGLVVRLAISTLVPVILIIIVSFRTQEMKYVRVYLRNVYLLFR